VNRKTLQMYVNMMQYQINNSDKFTNQGYW